MKNKIVLRVELLILIILFSLFILSVFYVYISLKRSENNITPSQHLIEPSSKSNPVRLQSGTPRQESILTCFQIDKAIYDNISKKYSVTLGSNSSNAVWSIQSNLNCSPTGGSGSIFTTGCSQLGTSTATVSYGTEQNTCDFSTEP